jgi:hypothetical protein
MVEGAVLGALHSTLDECDYDGELNEEQKRELMMLFHHIGYDARQKIYDWANHNENNYRMNCVITMERESR